jgi:predicted metalloendopeptidase
MDEFINAGELPEGHPLKKLLVEIRREERMKKAIEEMAEQQSEDAENKILLKFWQEVGDLPGTYFQSMNMIHQFVEALASLRETVTFRGHRRAIILRALSDCMLFDIKSEEMVLKAKEEALKNEQVSGNEPD